MSGPEVTYVPNAQDGRTIIVKCGDRVTAYKPLDARLLHARLGKALAQTIDTVPSRPERMSDYQRRRLHALFREHAVTGDERFTVLAKILGREIGSTNDLTPGEANECIDILHRTRPVRRTDGSAF